MCIYAATATHVVVDVTGWIGPDGSLTLDELDSQRVVDSRERLGFAGPLRAGHDLRDRSVRCPLRWLTSVPSQSNVTAVRPTARGYLTIDDCSGRAAADVVAQRGRRRCTREQRDLRPRNRPTAVRLHDDHHASDHRHHRRIRNRRGPALRPGRSRASPRHPRPPAPRARRQHGRSTSRSPTPDNALSTTPGAASVNLTAARPRSGGFVTAWDCGPRPATSALNPTADASTANGGIGPALTQRPDMPVPLRRRAPDRRSRRLVDLNVRRCQAPTNMSGPRSRWHCTVRWETLDG